MPVRYDQDTKAKAIRLVREHAGDYPSEYAAITAVARRLGMAPETLRKWIRQAAVDEGQAPGVSTEAAREIRELRRKVPRAGADGRDPVGGRRVSSRGSTTRCAADLRVHRRPPGPFRGRADLPCPVRAGHRDRPADVLGAPVPAAVAAGAAGRGADGDPGRDLRAGPGGRRPPECLYGSLKMWEHLRRQGITVARCTVERLMRATVAGRHPRPHRAHHDPGPGASPRPGPGQAGFQGGPARAAARRGLHLRAAGRRRVRVHGAGVDAFAGLIPGWECSLSKETAFVERAIRQAAALRARQGHPLGDGAVHHSDAGSQYTSVRFAETLLLEGLTPSVGTVGDALDNALAETTVGPVQDRVHPRGLAVPRRPVRTLADLEEITSAWVHWYNTSRLMHRLGRRPPAEAEAGYYRQAKDAA